MMNETVFDTEMTVVTFSIIIAEVLILFFQIINYLSRPHDYSRLRFLVLIILFFIYNITCGLLPDTHFPIPIIAQLIIAYTGGIILPIYYFYFLTVEFDISLGSIFNYKFLVVSLFSFLIFGYLIVWYITEDLNFARLSFAGLTLIISYFYTRRTILQLIKIASRKRDDRTPFKFFLLSSYFGILFMITLPIMTALGDFQTIEVSLVNMCLLLTTISYLKRHIYQSKLEHKLLKNVNKYETNSDIEYLKTELTSRELEVAFMIVKEELRYSDIALEMYVSPKTVSKHASNIFKKTNSCNRNEFINKFSHLSDYQLKN